MERRTSHTDPASSFTCPSATPRPLDRRAGTGLGAAPPRWPRSAASKALPACLFALALVACGEGGGDGKDAVQGDNVFGGDGGLGAALDCPHGQHDCGGNCVPDEPNFPENGCRTGCNAPCGAPASGYGEAICNADGACDLACDAGYEPLGGDCVCAAQASCEAAGVTCGPIDDGCGGVLDCGSCGDGAVCSNGQCTTCSLDTGEPNDKEESATDLGMFTDSPKTEMVFPDYGLDSDIDVDWFTAKVADKFGITNPGNPDVTVALTGIPDGDDYDLAAWYVCDSDGGGTCDIGNEDPSDGGNACLAETPGTVDETVKIGTSCAGTNESGTLIVRVRATTWTASCAPYSLRVRVD